MRDSNKINLSTTWILLIRSSTAWAFFAQPKKNPSSLYELAHAAFELLQIMIAKNEYSFEKHRLELHMNGS